MQVSEIPVVCAEGLPMDKRHFGVVIREHTIFVPSIIYDALIECEAEDDVSAFIGFVAWSPRSFAELINWTEDEVKQALDQLIVQVEEAFPDIPRFDMHHPLPERPLGARLTQPIFIVRMETDKTLNNGMLGATIVNDKVHVPSSIFSRLRRLHAHNLLAIDLLDMAKMFPREFTTLLNCGGEEVARQRQNLLKMLKRAFPDHAGLFDRVDAPRPKRAFGAGTNKTS